MKAARKPMREELWAAWIVLTGSLIAGLAAAPVSAATIDWVGGSGGNNWNNTANWGGSLPNSPDVGDIHSTPTAVATNDFSGSGTIQISTNGRLNLNASISTPITLNGGILSPQSSSIQSGDITLTADSSIYWDNAYNAAAYQGAITGAGMKLTIRNFDANDANENSSRSWRLIPSSGTNSETIVLRSGLVNVLPTSFGAAVVTNNGSIKGVLALGGTNSTHYTQTITLDGGVLSPFYGGSVSPIVDSTLVVNSPSSILQYAGGNQYRVCNLTMTNLAGSGDLVFDISPDTGHNGNNWKIELTGPSPGYSGKVTIQSTHGNQTTASVQVDQADSLGTVVTSLEIDNGGDANHQGRLQYASSLTNINVYALKVNDTVYIPGTYLISSIASGAALTGGAAGATITVLPLPAAPLVDNNGGATTSSNSATLYGNVSQGYPIPATYFCWGATSVGQDTGAWQHVVSMGSQFAIFSNTISGLTASSTYYYCCFATNSLGGAWSAVTNFTTRTAFSSLVAWVGGANGNDWNTATNWSSGSLPLAPDVGDINSAPTAVANGNFAGDGTIQISTNGRLNLSASISTPITLNGGILSPQSSGSQSADITLTADSYLRWDNAFTTPTYSGTITGNGKTLYISNYEPGDSTPTSAGRPWSLIPSSGTNSETIVLLSGLVNVTPNSFGGAALVTTNGAVNAILALGGAGSTHYTQTITLNGGVLSTYAGGTVSPIVDSTVVINSPSSISMFAGGNQYRVCNLTLNNLSGSTNLAFDISPDTGHNGNNWTIELTGHSSNFTGNVTIQSTQGTQTSASVKIDQADSLGTVVQSLEIDSGGTNYQGRLQYASTLSNINVYALKVNGTTYDVGTYLISSFASGNAITGGASGAIITVKSAQRGTVVLIR